MKIHKVIGERGVMPLCKDGACPAAVLVDGGHVFIQGYLPAQAESAALVAPNGEGFVKMPLATFKQIAGHVLAESS